MTLGFNLKVLMNMSKEKTSAVLVIEKTEEDKTKTKSTTAVDPQHLKVKE